MSESQAGQDAHRREGLDQIANGGAVGVVDPGPVRGVGSVFGSGLMASSSAFVRHLAPPTSPGPCRRSRGSSGT